MGKANPLTVLIKNAKNGGDKMNIVEEQIAIDILFDVMFDNDQKVLITSSSTERLFSIFKMFASAIDEVGAVKDHIVEIIIKPYPNIKFKNGSEILFRSAKLNDEGFKFLNVGNAIAGDLASFNNLATKGIN